MRQITSSSLANQSLTTALLCHTYTADADRLLFARLFADQVAGNGTYTAYITIRRLGAGSAYEVQPRTAAAVVSGITAIGFTTVPLPVKNTDVVKVYLLGLAGDTTTPDIVTEIWEDEGQVLVEAGLDVLGYRRLAAASLAGKLSGAATTTVTIRNAVADSKARITATVDSDGNRSAVTTDVT